MIYRTYMGTVKQIVNFVERGGMVCGMCVYVCLGPESLFATILVLHSAGCHRDSTAVAVETSDFFAPDKLNNPQVSKREVCEGRGV